MADQTPNPAPWISVHDARKLIPGTPHCTTIVRWITKGLICADRTRLQLGGMFVARKCFTTREAIAEFLTEQTRRRIAFEQREYEMVTPREYQPLEGFLPADEAIKACIERGL